MLNQSYQNDNLAFLKQVAAVGIPKQTVDVWEFTGSRKEVKWTWDLSRNCNKQVCNY